MNSFEGGTVFLAFPIAWNCSTKRVRGALLLSARNFAEVFSVLLSSLRFVNAYFIALLFEGW